MNNELRRAAFIDRDGVINEERNYVGRLDDFILLPGATRGLRSLKKSGYLLIVVTNQSGIGRGYYSVQDFNRLTEYMQQLLLNEGVEINKVYYCPHHSVHGLGEYKVECECRKPKPGMILQASGELGIDLGQSILIGDKDTDIQAGRSAGVGHCLLVSSGHTLKYEDRILADATVSSIDHAALWLKMKNSTYKK